MSETLVGLLERIRRYRNPPKGSFAYRHQQMPGHRGPDYFNRQWGVIRQDYALKRHAAFEGYPEVKVFVWEDDHDE